MTTRTSSLLVEVGRAVYAFVAYCVGTNIFHGPHTSAIWGELLRALDRLVARRQPYRLQLIMNADGSIQDFSDIGVSTSQQ